MISTVSRDPNGTERARRLFTTDVQTIGRRFPFNSSRDVLALTAVGPTALRGDVLVYEITNGDAIIIVVISVRHVYLVVIYYLPSCWSSRNAYIIL